MDLDNRYPSSALHLLVKHLHYRENLLLRPLIQSIRDQPFTEGQQCAVFMNGNSKARLPGVHIPVLTLASSGDL